MIKMKNYFTLLFIASIMISCVQDVNKQRGEKLQKTINHNDAHSIQCIFQ